MSNEQENTINKENGKETSETPKRNLGSEWLDWNGQDVVISADAKKGLFLGFLFIIILTFIATMFAIWYLVQPRLVSLTPSSEIPVIERIIFWTATGLSGLLLVLYLMFFLTAVLEKNFIFPLLTHLIYRYMVNRVIETGKRLKTSTDKLSNSFIKVNNSIIRAMNRKKQFNKVIIILPRCLHPDIRQKISDMKDTYHIDSYTVAGGSLALKIIKKERPDGLIVVACERDLVAGVKDLGGLIPVIAITNKRPEGPCLRTCINLDELETAIRFFTGKLVPLDKTVSQPAAG